MNKSNFIIIHLILAIFYTQIGLPLISNTVSLYAAATTSCNDLLNQADEFYFNAKFDKAIGLIRQCIKNPNLKKSDRLRAYQILTRIFLAKNEKDKATKIAIKVLEIEPDYQPTIEKEKPDYIELISSLRTIQTQKIAEKEKPKQDSKKWWWIGGGAVIALGITAMIIGSGGNEEENKSLPEPPKFPTN